MKTMLVTLLSLLVLFSNVSGQVITGLSPKGPQVNTGTLEKMIVANGNVQTSSKP